ncbi:MAG: bifunctional DNA-binding transcriptional regulator/O6-methylguanine-DNA methyltransferase Ada [Alphaproteobacteria bacterium]|nr:bifunctional DNA-binding transcriptional regulator/O6-methylguanine-DNA methyltransferase Ada [Alphaproteobacteria bacterium]
MMQSDQLAAILARDSRADGRFVYAVRTTGIYCRPGCPSRRPKPGNIRLYPGWREAEEAGYRACLRCHPKEQPEQSPTLQAIGRAAEAIRRHVGEGEEGPPSLEQLARHAGLSPWHLQRVFKREVGVSPREYADALRLDRLRATLREGQGVASAVYGAGFGSASRVYERADRLLGMTPATYARGGAGARIGFAIRDCSLGKLLVAATAKGICKVALGPSDAALRRELVADLPRAEIVPDEAGLGPALDACLAILAGREPPVSLALDLRATAFQWRVWQELQRIPRGETRSYREIAVAIGQPQAARAVARACASNPAALVVPCHRVVREDGGLGGYRWGIRRKETLLAAEGARPGRRAAR